MLNKNVCHALNNPWGTGRCLLNRMTIYFNLRGTALFYIYYPSVIIKSAPFHSLKGPVWDSK